VCWVAVRSWAPCSGLCIFVQLWPPTCVVPCFLFARVIVPVPPPTVSSVHHVVISCASLKQGCDRRILVVLLCCSCRVHVSDLFLELVVAA
jgi:hypothetical protein